MTAWHRVYVPSLYIHMPQIICMHAHTHVGINTQRQTSMRPRTYAHTVNTCLVVAEVGSGCPAVPKAISHLENKTQNNENEKRKLQFCKLSTMISTTANKHLQRISPSVHADRERLTSEHIHHQCRETTSTIGSSEQMLDQQWELIKHSSIEWGAERGIFG